MTNPLKPIYLHLARFPWVVRLRESYRKNIQMRYWPWYRHKPRKPGTDPSALYKHELIVSLTSFPARIHLVRFAIYSLMRQSLKPNRIVLWLANEQFPGKENALSKDLLDLIPLGLEIRWCEDLKSFKKLIPSLRQFPDAIIVTADDDMFYPRHWLRSLYQSWTEHESCIHCGGMRKIVWNADGTAQPFGMWVWNPQKSCPSFDNTQVGLNGVLYPPHALHPDVMESQTWSQVSPSSDDLWFWAMAVRMGTKIQLVQNDRQQPLLIPDSLATPCLWSQNHSGGGNDRCFVNLLQVYPELRELLQRKSFS